MNEPTSPGLTEDPLLAVRPGSEYCRACGGAWFGVVAYCPYCGRAAASQPVAPAVDVAMAESGDRIAGGPDATRGADDSWTSWAHPLTAGAVLGVILVVIVVLILRASGHSP